MIIDCISDLHGFLPELEGGHLLIIAGDLTARDIKEQHLEFSKWLAEQKYEKVVLIAGNHDGKMNDWMPMEIENLSYLRDSGCKFNGMKIWGSPWTPEFYNWHFMKKRGQELKEVWDKIPLDTDILITHGPAYGILEKVALNSHTDKYKHVGCEELRLAVERIKPKLHIFGHIHSQGGNKLIFKHSGPNTICVNASIMNEDYIPVNKPIRVIL